jgi:hypothetical protein
MKGLPFYTIRSCSDGSPNSSGDSRVPAIGDYRLAEMHTVLEFGDGARPAPMAGRLRVQLASLRVAYHNRQAVAHHLSPAWELECELCNGSRWTVECQASNVVNQGVGKGRSACCLSQG